MWSRRRSHKFRLAKIFDLEKIRPFANHFPKCDICALYIARGSHFIKTARWDHNIMPPSKPLPFGNDFANADEYVDSLLQFSAASTIFQTLCGGVHILDFFTREPSLYYKVIPAEWRTWLLAQDSMDLLNLLMRDDLVTRAPRADDAPESLIRYIKEIRKHSLQRPLPHREKIAKLPRHVAVGSMYISRASISYFAAIWRSWEAWNAIIRH